MKEKSKFILTNKIITFVSMFFVIAFGILILLYFNFSDIPIIEYTKNDYYAWFEPIFACFSILFGLFSIIVLFCIYIFAILFIGIEQIILLILSLIWKEKKNLKNTWIYNVVSLCILTILFVLLWII